MTIHDLKDQRQEKVSALIAACGMFFAFSDKQWEENKTPLKEGEKYLRMFGGSFMPAGNLEQWRAGDKEIGDWFREQIETHNLRRAHIAYELANHEAYYTHEIDQALDALGEGYTREEVQKIFWEELPLHDND